MILFGMAKRNFKRLGMCFHTEGDDDGAGGGAGGDDGNQRMELDVNFGGEDDGDDGGEDDTDKGKGDGGSSSLFEIPEAYKEKTYAKELKTQEDVWKMLDNAQSLIGKKIGVPTDASTPEEIAVFNKAFGVPERAEEYAIEPSEEITKMYGEADKEVMAEFKQVLHKAGASAKQAEILKEGYSNIVGGIFKKIEAQKAETDKAFDELVNSTFGDKQEEILANAKALIVEHAPEGFREKMGDLSPESLVILAGVLKNIQEKYIDEDELPGGKGGGSGMSEMTAQAEIQKIIGSEAFKNPMHSGHNTAKTEFQRLSGVLDSIRRGKK